ncbi:hypothetical protein DFA_07453 [Cavenderia fasciculata]|uniref:Ankyrin repeat-containing protein n=1 Tax=Cavenderia fasciculata TaxID=261658 RepID=F4PWG5_CACFS|nr:uncharacterized protein DFA_07453 [Cavenderia fasciculata]EGG20329.1 hypothetical protein DFA_07453 [Cavenderia fasciculata]|eukprot:XP_004367312.1 hypothetical protein DFA_07453 [Cavenderia fasciculata]
MNNKDTISTTSTIENNNNNKEIINEQHKNQNNTTTTTTTLFFSIIKNNFLTKKIFNEQKKQRLDRWGHTFALTIKAFATVRKWKYDDWIDLEDMCRNGYHRLLYDKIVGSSSSKKSSCMRVTESGVLVLCSTLTDYSLFVEIYNRRREWFVHRLVIANACKAGNMQIIKLLMAQTEPRVLPRDLAIEQACEGGHLNVLEYLFKELPVEWSSSTSPDPFYTFQGALSHFGRTDVYEYIRGKVSEECFAKFVQSNRRGVIDHFELVSGDTDIIKQFATKKNPMHQLNIYLDTYRHHHHPTTQHQIIQLLLDRLQVEEMITTEEHAKASYQFPPKDPKSYHFVTLDDQIAHYIAKMSKAIRLSDESFFGKLSEHSTEFLCYLSKNHSFSMFIEQGCTDGYIQPCPTTHKIATEAMESVGHRGDLTILNHLISVTSLETARTYSLASACKYGNVNLVARLLDGHDQNETLSIVLEFQKEAVVYNQLHVLDYFYDNEIYTNKTHFLKEIIRYAYQRRSVPSIQWALSKDNDSNSLKSYLFNQIILRMDGNFQLSF